MATIAVGLALVGASVAMVALLERSLTSNVREVAEGRAESIAARLEAGADATLDDAEADEAFAQIVAVDGSVVAASANVEGLPAVAAPPSGSSVRVDRGPVDDGPFLVVALGLTTSDGARTVLVGRSLEDVDEAVAAVVPLLLVGVPLLTLLVGVVTWLITGRALAPVEAIRARVETISAGELDRRVPEPGTGDEVDRLAATMNGMLARLDRAQARQRRFVADAAHELRSPVAAIRQHSEVAIEHPEATSLERLASVVHDENLRVEALVDDLLLLARLDEAESRPWEPVDLDEVVRAEAAHAGSGAHVRVDVVAIDAVRVRGRRADLRRAIANLLDNAVRHARSAVSVSARAEDGRAVVTIDDDGPGVPEAERDRVFERFVRLDDARSRDEGGAGLGLAIARSIAEAHGGSVTVGEAASGGASFRLELERDG